MNQSMLFSFFNPSVLLLLYLLVVLIFFVHRELLHLPNDRRGVERSLPLAFDEVFLHLCTDRGMNISVQGGVTRNPTMQKTKLYRGEACLSVARSYLPTAALPRRGSLPVSSEAFAALCGLNGECQIVFWQMQLKM